MRPIPLSAIVIAGALVVPLTVAAQDRRPPPAQERVDPPPGPGPAMEDDDDDDDNAKNPARPSTGGDGQETGGPARNREPN